MKLGLFDHMQKHDIPRRSYRDLYKSHLELVEMADQEWIFILSRSTISISSKVVNSGRAASTVEIASGIVATSRDRSAMSRAWTWARSWRRGYHRLVETLGLEAADGQAQTPRSSWL